MKRQDQLFSTSANGSFVYTFTMSPTQAASPPNPYPSNETPGGIDLRFSAVGSGAVGAVVTAYRGAKFGGTVRYDDTPAATVTLSGTNIATDSQSFHPTGSMEWKFVVSGITGSTTVSGVADWWSP